MWMTKNTLFCCPVLAVMKSLWWNHVCILILPKRIIKYILFLLLRPTSLNLIWIWFTDVFQKNACLWLAYTDTSFIYSIYVWEAMVSLHGGLLLTALSDTYPHWASVAFLTLSKGCLFLFFFWSLCIYNMVACLFIRFPKPVLFFVISLFVSMTIHWREIAVNN